MLLGWRAWLASYLAGVVMMAAFAPFYVWPVLFVVLPLFYRLLNAAPTGREAARRGFFFGYGHAMAGTYWIANALLVDAEKFGWLYPFSVLGLSAVLAIWFALFGWWFHALRSSQSLTNIIRFAALWLLIEYLRSVGMFGFPWNLAGYTALASIHVAQLASIIGVFGLSFLVVLVGTLPVLGYRKALVAIALIVGTAYGYGAWRMPQVAALTNTHLRIVQPSVPQAVKWTPQGKMESLKLHVDMMRTEKEVTPDVIIWSESAFPYTLRADSPWPPQLGSLLLPNQLLLTGAMRAEGEGANLKLWNSMVAIDGKGVVRATYDKHQLVPFGEFMPLRDVLPLDKITPGETDFSRGAGPQTVSVDTIPPFSPLVCYEVIFPWLAVNKQVRPQWLLNVTNDGWYGNATGPYQHYAAAQIRAIEQGLPVVRAANNGISAVIDPYGRAVAQLALNQRGIIDSLLPAAAASTLYARHGLAVAIITAILSLVVAFMKLTLTKNK